MSVVAPLTHTIRMDLSGQSGIKSGYLGVPAPGNLVDITSLVDLDAGITRRWGRDDQFADAPTPGTLTFIVDNRDGRFTPNNPLGMFSRGAIKGTLVVWDVSNGTTTRRLKYRIESVLASFPGGTSGSTQVMISCRDALGQLATTEARSALEIDVLARSYYGATPIFYWGLDEGSEATSAAESSGNRGPEMVVVGDLDRFPDALGWGSGGGPGGDGKGGLIFGTDAPAIVDPVDGTTLAVTRRGGGSSVIMGWPYLAPATPSLPSPNPWTRGAAAFAAPAIGDKVMLAVECWALAEVFEVDSTTTDGDGLSPRNSCTLWEMVLADGTVLNFSGVYELNGWFAYYLTARRASEGTFNAFSWVSKVYDGPGASGHLGRTHHLYVEIVQTFTGVPTPGVGTSASYTCRLVIDGVQASTSTATNRLVASTSVNALRPTNFTIGGGPGDLTRQQGTWIGTIARVAVYNEARRVGQLSTIRPWPLDRAGGLLARVAIGTDKASTLPIERIQYLLERTGLPYGSYPNWLPGHDLTATYGAGSYPRAGINVQAFSVDTLSQQDSAGQSWLSVIAEALRQDRSTLFCWGGTANGDDEPIIPRGFDQLHPYHSALTVSVQDDQVGVPAFVGELSGRVSSATAKAWRRSATYVDQDLVDQLGAQSATVAAAVDSADGLYRIAETRVSSGSSASVSLSPVTVDRQLMVTAASANLHLLVPGNRITVTDIPPLFGVTTVDHYVIGGEELHRVGSELFTLITEPADAPPEGVFFPAVRNDAGVIRTEDHPSTTSAEIGSIAVVVPDEYGRYGATGCTVSTAVTAAATTLDVARPAGAAAWTVAVADYPLTIQVRGEKIRCPNPPTVVSATVQRFTGVTRAYGGTVARQHAVGETVDVADAPTFALGHYASTWATVVPGIIAASDGTGTAVAAVIVGSSITAVSSGTGTAAVQAARKITAIAVTKGSTGTAAASATTGAGALPPIPTGDGDGGFIYLGGQDFLINAALGEAKTKYGNWIGAYDGALDTSDAGTYNSNKTVTVQDGVYDVWVHHDDTDNKNYVNQAIPPFRPENSTWGQLLGEYEWLQRHDGVVGGDGYKQAFLWWPAVTAGSLDPRGIVIYNVWDLGEIDFGEGGLGKNVEAYLHFAQGSVAGQTSNDRNHGNAFADTTLGASFNDWHRYKLRWSQERVSGWIDGVRVWTTTNPAAIPFVKTEWRLQVETRLSGTVPATAEGHVQVGWFVMRRAPSFDTFGRANSTTTLGEDTTGNPWTAHSGVGGISGSRGYCVSGSLVAGVDLPAVTKPRVQCFVKAPNSGTAGIYALGDGANDRVAFYFNGTAGMKLSKVIGGTITDLTASVPIPTGIDVGDSPPLRLEIDGADVTGFVNSVQVISGTLSAGDLAALTGTQCGIRQSVPGADVTSFSHFSVTQIVD